MGSRRWGHPIPRNEGCLPCPQPGPPPIGPEVDTTPRPLPARVPIRGQYVTLEPLHRRHAAELWQAAKAPMRAGPTWFGTICLRRGHGARQSWTSRRRTTLCSGRRGRSATGVVSGWLALMDIQPKHASIELGNIWFSPRMQRTRAATEAIFLTAEAGGG